MRAQVQSPIVAWLATGAVFATVLALYLLAAQNQFYRNDAASFVQMVTTGHFAHPLHVLYPQVLRGVRWATEPMHWSALRVATAASALGGAVGVALWFRAAWLAVGPRAAWWVVACCAVTPAVFFFATVTEVHGPFLAAVGLAWWAAVQLERQPTRLRALAAGAATGLAAQVHASGHLLAPLLLLWLWGGGGSLRLWLGRATWLIAAHAAVHLGIGTLFAGEVAASGALFQFARHQLDEARETQLLGIVALEWLLPYAPFSLAFLLALRRGGEPRRALALTLAVAMYVTAAYAVLGYARERGAYLLPLAFPAAVLTIRSIGTRGAWLALAVAALGSAAINGAAVAPREGSAFVADMRESLRGCSPVVIVGGRDEMNGVLRDWSDLPMLPVHQLVLGDAGTAQLAIQNAFDALVEQSRSAGLTVVLTEWALRALEFEPDSPTAALAAHLAAHYRWVWLRQGAFAGIRLEPR